MADAAAQPVPVPDADRALARRLEAAHGWCIAQYAASLQRLRPQLGAAVLEIAGALAIYAGPSPFSFTVGLGMSAPVTMADLDQIEEFFAPRGHATRIDVTPYSDLSLRKLLHQRGYRVSEITSVLMRDLQEDLPAFVWPEDITLRWAEPNDCQAWIDIVARCFFVREPGPERRNNMAAMFQVPNSLSVLALRDNAVVGAAGGMVPDDLGIAALFASATLAEFRRRGIHGAMLHFRLQRAKALGCKLALVTATPGSASERNLHRYGFRACYEKVTWEKPLQG